MSSIKITTKAEGGSTKSQRKFFPQYELKLESKSRPQVLREFGLLMSLVFVILTGVCFYKASCWVLSAAIAALFFSVAAIRNPLFLDSAETVWMRFAEHLSGVVSKIVVILTFYVAITPLAFLLRILRKDLLEIRLVEKESYFHPINPLEGTEEEKATRYRQPF